MPDEPDITEILASTSDSPADPGHHVHTPSASTHSVPADAICEIVIERDLAVMLVGSDSGKMRRMRPHGAMTEGASPEELANVTAVMEPFLDDEIRRIHEEKTHCPKAHVARATPAQAASIKTFCVRFAVALEQNIGKHPGDDNRHRSQQRLDQARRVIAQVNAALGLPPEDGRTLQQCRLEAIAKVEALDTALAALGARTDVADAGSAISPLVELHDAVRRCLSFCGRS